MLVEMEVQTLSPGRLKYSYEAVIVGSGPAGLAALGTLLEKQLPGKMLWVDPDFAAGRLDKTWREVLSNTNVELFLSYANALEPFRQVVARCSKPNAITALEGLAQDAGCKLAYAADMCLMLSKGLWEHEQVETRRAMVTGADWNSSASKWTVEIGSSTSDTSTTVSSSRLILSTGSAPCISPIPVSGVCLQRIDLETALTPSILGPHLSKTSPTVVAVIGASHSAILVLLNLCTLAKASHAELRIVWFTRHELRYAEPQDGWILRDSTGLKGQAADFARQNLEDSALPTSPVSGIVRRVFCGDNEQQMYETWLPKCTHIVQATGFSANPLPTLTLDGSPIGEVQYDHHTGGFTDKRGIDIPGLYGAGIAFPEKVSDPAGKVEHNVGMWKFMKYLKRVGAAWAERPQRAP